MIIPILILFVVSSIIWLVIGIRNRNEIALLLLNIFWWIGSFFSAYFTWLVWLDRGYSENWAMISFMFISLPYIFIAGGMAAAQLFFIRKWKGGKIKTLRSVAVCMLIFLVIQMIVGLLSA